MLLLARINLGSKTSEILLHIGLMFFVIPKSFSMLSISSENEPIPSPCSFSHLQFFYQIHIDSDSILFWIFQSPDHSGIENEILCRFFIPEKGALMKLLEAFCGRWNISLFNYQGQVMLKDYSSSLDSQLSKSSLLLQQFLKSK